MLYQLSYIGFILPPAKAGLNTFAARTHGLRRGLQSAARYACWHFADLSSLQFTHTRAMPQLTAGVLYHLSYIGENQQSAFSRQLSATAYVVTSLDFVQRFTAMMQP